MKCNSAKNRHVHHKMKCSNLCLPTLANRTAEVEQKIAIKLSKLIHFHPAVCVSDHWPIWSCLKRNLSIGKHPRLTFHVTNVNYRVICHTLLWCTFVSCWEKCNGDWQLFLTRHITNLIKSVMCNVTCNVTWGLTGNVKCNIKSLMKSVMGTGSRS